MDIRVYEADILRVTNVLKHYIALIGEDEMAKTDKHFISYFLKKYVELPNIRKNESTCYNRYKDLIKENEAAANNFYKGYLQYKKERQVVIKELEKMKKKYLYL